MCRVALIDDIKDQYKKYKIMLQKKGIDLIFMEYIPDFPAIIQWLLDERIEFVLVDYKLDTKYRFQGSQLIYEINNSIPNLQCMLFTSNISDDDLVLNNLKIDKSIFYDDDEKYNEFIELIKQAARVFNNRQQKTLEDYEKLKSKKQLTATEEQDLKKLYNRLVSFGKVEKLPEELMQTRVEQKMDNLIETIEKYIKDKK